MKDKDIVEIDIVAGRGPAYIVQYPVNDTHAYEKVSVQEEAGTWALTSGEGEYFGEVHGGPPGGAYALARISNGHLELMPVLGYVQMRANATIGATEISTNSATRSTTAGAKSSTNTNSNGIKIALKSLSVNDPSPLSSSNYQALRLREEETPVVYSHSIFDPWLDQS